LPERPGGCFAQMGPVPFFPLGAPVHASIDGTVTAVRDGVVWIEK